MDMFISGKVITLLEKAFMSLFTPLDGSKSTLDGLTLPDGTEPRTKDDWAVLLGTTPQIAALYLREAGLEQKDLTLQDVRNGINERMQYVPFDETKHLGPGPHPDGSPQLVHGVRHKPPKFLLSMAADLWIGGQGEFPHVNKIREHAKNWLKRRPDKDTGKESITSSQDVDKVSAGVLLDAIYSAKPTDRPLHRGLHFETGYPPQELITPGSEFTEALATWTPDESVAQDFAEGVYTFNPFINSHIVMHCKNAPAVPLIPYWTSYDEDSESYNVITEADERITSGKYRVIKVESYGGGEYDVEVEWIGPVTPERAWQSLDEDKAIRHVQDAEYWGRPVGTPIVPGMKPRAPINASRLNDWLNGAAGKPVPKPDRGFLKRPKGDAVPTIRRQAPRFRVRDWLNNANKPESYEIVQVDEPTMDGLWKAIIGNNDYGVLDPREAHPERYEPNRGFSVHLKPGERETHIDESSHGDRTKPPMLYDTTGVVGTLEDAKRVGTPVGMPMNNAEGNNVTEVRLPDSDRPAPFVWRIMDEREFQQAQERGYFQSNESMNMASYEGTVASLGTTGSFYNPAPGSRARIVRLRVDPADGWWLDNDTYAKTNARIPFDRVDAVTPSFTTRVNGQVSLDASDEAADVARWEEWPWDARKEEGPRPGDTPPERNLRGDFVVYHSTTREALDRIMYDGMLRPDDLGAVGVGTTPEAVRVYGQMHSGADSVVLRIEISPYTLRQAVIQHEVGGSGHDQFLVGPAHGQEGPWDGLRINPSQVSIVDESKIIRHVRDSAFWHLPVGTPIVSRVRPKAPHARTQKTTKMKVKARNIKVGDYLDEQHLVQVRKVQTQNGETEVRWTPIARGDMARTTFKADSEVFIYRPDVAPPKPKPVSRPKPVARPEPVPEPKPVAVPMDPDWMEPEIALPEGWRQHRRYTIGGDVAQIESHHGVLSSSYGMVQFQAPDVDGHSGIRVTLPEKYLRNAPPALWETVDRLNKLYPGYCDDILFEKPFKKWVSPFNGRVVDRDNPFAKRLEVLPRGGAVTRMRGEGRAAAMSIDETLLDPEGGEQGHTWEEFYRRDAQSGFHTGAAAFVSPAVYSLVHEFGHVIDAHQNVDISGIAYSGYATMPRRALTPEEFLRRADVINGGTAPTRYGEQSVMEEYAETFTSWWFKGAEGVTPTRKEQRVMSLTDEVAQHENWRKAIQQFIAWIVDDFINHKSSVYVEDVSEQKTIENKLRHVRDAEYWHLPVGTPIVAGMRPRVPKVSVNRSHVDESGTLPESERFPRSAPVTRDPILDDIARLLEPVHATEPQHFDADYFAEQNLLDLDIELNDGVLGPIKGRIIGTTPTALQMHIRGGERPETLTIPYENIRAIRPLPTQAYFQRHQGERYTIKLKDDTVVVGGVSDMVGSISMWLNLQNDEQVLVSYGDIRSFEEGGDRLGITLPQPRIHHVRRIDPDFIGKLTEDEPGAEVQIVSGAYAGEPEQEFHGNIDTLAGNTLYLYDSSIRGTWAVDLQNVTELRVGRDSYVVDASLRSRPNHEPVIPRDDLRKMPLKKDVLLKKAKDSDSYAGSLNEMDPEEAAVLVQAFEVRIPNGMHTEIRRAYRDGGTYIIEGVVQNEDNENIGTFGRHIMLDRNPPEMHNALLDINERYQGQGLSDAFYNQSEKVMLEQGIQEISIQADIKVGGYAWARRGFDWATPNGPRLFLQRMQEPEYITRMNPDAREIAREEWDLMVRRLQEAQETGNITDAPHPWEIAAIGEDIAEAHWTSYTDGGVPIDMWPGKALMLGTNWLGRKPVGWAPPKPVKSLAETDYFVEIAKLYSRADELFIPGDRMPDDDATGDYNVHLADLLFSYNPGNQS